jgi:hypothetical protein
MSFPEINTGSARQPVRTYIKLTPLRRAKLERERIRYRFEKGEATNISDIIARLIDEKWPD